MKTIFTLTLILISIWTFGQKGFSRLSVSNDSTYGYTATNPLKMKRGNPEKSFGYTFDFLSGLQTEDNGELKFLQRLTVKNPTRRKSKRASDPNKETLSGKGVQLDKYVFLTSQKDTLTIYVDLYSKDQLKMPIGLRYR